MLVRIISGPVVKSKRSQASAHSSPRRAPVTIASQTNMPQSGSFQASAEMRAACSVVGGCGFGGGAAGGFALSMGLTLIHFHRTARSHAPLRIASI